MKKVPKMVGRTLRNQTETVPSSRRAVRLLVPGKLILETTANPTGFELGVGGTRYHICRGSCLEADDQECESVDSTIPGV